MAVDKKANFIRIAEARTNKIIESITLLGNLSNTSYYCLLYTSPSPRD